MRWPKTILLVSRNGAILDCYEDDREAFRALYPKHRIYALQPAPKRPRKKKACSSG